MRHEKTHEPSGVTTVLSVALGERLMSDLHLLALADGRAPGEYLARVADAHVNGCRPRLDALRAVTTTQKDTGGV